MLAFDIVGDEVFSAYAEVVPLTDTVAAIAESILRVRGGSSSLRV